MSRSTLRCCASCEWIYEGNVDCPKCGFGSYSAHYVHGKKAYKYKVTQEPWLEKKVSAFRSKLWSEHIAPLNKRTNYEWFYLDKDGFLKENRYDV